jgi:hypothetical protein
MGGAESKREQQPIKATPKVQTMKACIVSMEYTIKNNDGKQ